MRRYWKRWVGLLVFVAVLGTTFVLLGRWQLNRLQERKDRNAVVIAHENKPPQDFATSFQRPIQDDDQWQRVTVTGTFDDAQTLQVRYRSNNGTQGPEFVTPLHANDGRTVLIDRGYIHQAAGRDPEAPPAPTGTVTITGYIRRDEQGPASATDPVKRQCRLINSRAIEKTVGYPLVDGYLSTVTMDPPETSLKPIPTPTLDEGPHLSYAIQWFCFCALALGGLFVFIRGDIRELRGKSKKPSRRNAPADAEQADEQPPRTARGVGGDVDEPGDVATSAGDDTPREPHTPAGATSVAEPEA